MKYLLNEKNVLKEKFTLVERFILNEAAGDEEAPAAEAVPTDILKEIKDHAKNIVDKLNSDAYSDNALDELKKKLLGGNGTVDELTKLQEKGQQLVNQLNRQSAWDTIKNSINGYIDELRKYIDGGEHKNNYSKVLKLLEPLKVLDTETSVNADKILNVLDNFKTVVKTLQNYKPSNDKNDEANIETIKSTKADIIAACDNANIDELLKAIDGAPEQKEGSDDGKGFLLERFSNLDKTLPAKFDMEELSKAVSAVATEMKSFKEAIVDEDAESNANVAAINNEDFDAQWKNAKTPEAMQDILKRAIESIFKDNVAKIKELNKSFILEVKEFGFKENNNPFIKYLLSLGDNIKNLSASVYATIHNAYVDKQLVTKDLRGEGIFGKRNIIFNNSFLSTDTATALECLSRQSTLKTKTVDPHAIPDKELPDKISQLNYIMFNKEIDPATDTTNEPLANLTDIKANATKLLGEETAVKNMAPVNDKEVADIISKFADIDKANILNIIWTTQLSNADNTTMAKAQQMLTDANLKLNDRLTFADEFRLTRSEGGQLIASREMRLPDIQKFIKALATKNNESGAN